MSGLVSFLVPDIGSPTVGAAVKLARMLEPEFQTEIIGPDFGRGICSLYRGVYPFTPVPAGKIYRLPDYFRECRRIAGEIKGDLVIAVKGFATTVPVALRVKKCRNVPVAVYLDEWDGALWHALSFKEKLKCWMKHAHHPAEPCYHAWVERRIHEADAVWSTTTWLQKRFGGEIIHAGVDCDFFKSQPLADVERLKSSLGLRDKKVIVFGGVARPHKGVEEILEALTLLDRDDIRLLIVGPVTELVDALMNSPRFGKWIVVAGDPVNAPGDRNAEIHKRMPLYLDVGNLVVLPLRNTLLAQSQMPIKIFEALAMGKPIVGTAVADLPRILDGCGKVVRPDDSRALARAILEVISNPGEAGDMGHLAREKCVREFHFEVVRKKLIDEVQKLIGISDPMEPAESSAS